MNWISWINTIRTITYQTLVLHIFLLLDSADKNNRSENYKIHRCLDRTRRISPFSRSRSLLCWVEWHYLCLWNRNSPEEAKQNYLRPGSSIQEVVQSLNEKQISTINHFKCMATNNHVLYIIPLSCNQTNLFVSSAKKVMLIFLYRLKEKSNIEVYSSPLV